MTGASRTDRERKRRASAPAVPDVSAIAPHLQRYSHVEGFGKSAVRRAIYHHAREYLVEANADSASEFGKGKARWKRALVAVRRAARTVVLKGRVVRALLDAVEERRQRKAQHAEDVWRRLSLKTPCDFEVTWSPEVGDEDAASAAARVAAALWDMLQGFDGAEVVQERFLNVASSFRESEASLRRFQTSFTGKLERLQEMQGKIEQCAEEALRLIKLFEGRVGAMRTQLRKTLRSRCPSAAEPRLSPLEDSCCTKHEEETIDDSIKSLLECLERDLCDRPMTVMQHLTDEVNMKASQAPLNVPVLSCSLRGTQHTIISSDGLKLEPVTSGDPLQTRATQATWKTQVDQKEELLPAKGNRMLVNHKLDAPALFEKPMCSGEDASSPTTCEKSNNSPIKQDLGSKFSASIGASDHHGLKSDSLRTTKSEYERFQACQDPEVSVVSSPRAIDPEATWNSSVEPCSVAYEPAETDDDLVEPLYNDGTPKLPSTRLQRNWGALGIKPARVNMLQPPTSGYHRTIVANNSKTSTTLNRDDNRVPAKSQPQTPLVESLVDHSQSRDDKFSVANQAANVDHVASKDFASADVYLGKPGTRGRIDRGESSPREAAAHVIPTRADGHSAVNKALAGATETIEAPAHIAGKLNLKRQISLGSLVRETGDQGERSANLQNTVADPILEEVEITQATREQMDVSKWSVLSSMGANRHGKTKLDSPKAIGLPPLRTDHPSVAKMLGASPPLPKRPKAPETIGWTPIRQVLASKADVASEQLPPSSTIRHAEPVVHPLPHLRMDKSASEPNLRSAKDRAADQSTIAEDTDTLVRSPLAAAGRGLLASVSEPRLLRGAVQVVCKERKLVKRARSMAELIYPAAPSEQLIRPFDGPWMRRDQPRKEAPSMLPSIEGQRHAARSTLRQRQPKSKLMPPGLGDHEGRQLCGKRGICK